MYTIIGRRLTSLLRCAAVSAAVALVPLQVVKGEPPKVEITSPSGAVTIASGQPVPLKGEATDNASGRAIPPRFMEWTSDRDGSLGRGPNVETQLSAGNHIVTLTATNAQGEKTRSTVAITVKSP